MFVAASTKGKRRRRCGLCNRVGHQRTTCRYWLTTARLVDEIGDHAAEEEEFYLDVSTYELIVPSKSFGNVKGSLVIKNYFCYLAS